MADFRQRITQGRGDDNEPEPTGIMASGGVANSNNEELKLFISALAVLSRHAHIVMEGGETEGAVPRGDLWGPLRRIYGSVIHYQIFPLVGWEGGQFQYKESIFDKIGEDNLQKMMAELPKIKEIYKDFPAAVAALDTIGNFLAVHHNDTQKIIRDNMSPEESKQLSNNIIDKFFEVPYRKFKPFQTANEQEKLELRKEIAALTPPKMLGEGKG